MTGPFPSGATGGLVLTGVTMELTGTGGPATVVTDVTLALRPDGLIVTPPSGAATAVPWSSMAWARCGEGGVLADGAPAVAVAAGVGGRLVRWLVPEAQMPSPRALAIDHLLTARTGGGALDEPNVTWTPSAADRRSGGGPPLVSARSGVGAPPVGAQPGVAASAPPETAPSTPRTGPSAPSAPRTPGPAPLALALTPRPPARRRDRGPRSLGILIAWLAIVALLLVGVGLVVAASIPVPHHPSNRSGPGRQQQVTQARAEARAVSLRLADLPGGWTVASTPSGPLSGFVGSGASVTSSPPGLSQAARRYARCLGVRAAAVPLVSVGPAPLAEATSGAFAGPATEAPMQVGSITAVYATRLPVRRSVSQLERHGFASCFGAAVGDELAQSLAAQAPSGVTTGTASTQVLPLPRWAGIRATGVDLTLPVDVHGEATSVQLGFVFVTGAKIEATLVSFSTTGVPQGISRTLAATLEEEMAAAGGA